MVGEDTRIAAQELTKLLTYVDFERPIRLLDVEKVSLVSAQASVFELVDALVSEPALRAYHLLPAVRGDLLAKLGRFREANAEFLRASELTRNVRERSLLRERAAECARSGDGQPDR